MVNKSDSGFPGHRIHICSSFTNTNHTFTRKTEHTDRPPVQVVCTVGIITPQTKIKYLNNYKSITVKRTSHFCQSSAVQKVSCTPITNVHYFIKYHFACSVGTVLYTYSSSQFCIKLHSSWMYSVTWIWTSRTVTEDVPRPSKHSPDSNLHKLSC